MRGRRILSVLVFSLLVSCGSQALITAPAQDLNLTAEDLGSGYAMAADEGLETFMQEMSVEDVQDIVGASYRTFQGESGVVVLSMAIVLDRAATEDNLFELASGFSRGLSESLGGVPLAEREPPALGEGAILRSVEVAEKDASLAFLCFRRANVIGVVIVRGAPSAPTSNLAVEFGQTFLAKLQ